MARKPRNLDPCPGCGVVLAKGEAHGQCCPELDRLRAEAAAKNRDILERLNDKAKEGNELTMRGDWEA